MCGNRNPANKTGHPKAPVFFPPLEGCGLSSVQPGRDRDVNNVRTHLARNRLKRGVDIIEAISMSDGLF